MASPRDWIAFLVRNNVRQIHLVARRSDAWGLQTHGGGEPLVWTNEWRDDWDDDEESTPDYRLATAETEVTAVAASDRDVATRTVETALSHALAFSKQHHTGFNACFEKGLRSLESKSPLRSCGYHPPVAARVYPLKARQLFAACWQSWVFGGMGSWNDTGFTNQRVMKRFTRVTSELSTALRNGLRVAVNSFPPSGHRA